MKKIISIVAVVLLLTTLFAIPAGAKSYQTYTYSSDGFALYSPDAYVPEIIVDSAYIGKEQLVNDLKNPSDIEVDDQGNVYLADTENDRIVVLDKYFKYKFVIDKFENENLIADALSKPQGVFITPSTIYVCDSGKNRIVTFDRSGNFLAIIPEPESNLFEEGSMYTPVAIAVDEFNRLFVVSSTTIEGVMVMTSTGEFTGFIGAQKTSLSAWDIIWRRFQTKAQREASKKNVGKEFNNITITDDGFIYVTTSTITAGDQQSAIKGKSKSGTYAPVKMLNAAGEEIMRRNGFWPPSGEVDVKDKSKDNSPVGASKVVDVAIGPEKTWSIIDNKRSKVYTYDFDGNMLFVFGDFGNQMGTITQNGLQGIVYQGDRMLLLDRSNKSFTVYKRTEYGDILIEALKNQNNRQFNLAVTDWTEILKRNSNYDAAYIGIGQSLYRSGEYAKSMEYFESAYDAKNWSESYKEIRKEWISQWILLIPLGVVLLCVGWSFFMKYCKKVNTRAAVAGGRRNFKEEIVYGFYVIFHPFDGFWDLKHEKRGSLKAATFYIVVTIFAFYYQAVGTGYVSNPRGSFATIVDQLLSVAVPLALWVVANWCLTTLFDGEGSFKDITIAVGYALIPMILVLVPTTIASNFLLIEELDILNLIVTIGYLWTGILIVLGMMVTHDYSMGKNIAISLFTIAGMIFIMFVALLFTTLLAKIVGFVSNIIVEINYRM